MRSRGFQGGGLSQGACRAARQAARFPPRAGLVADARDMGFGGVSGRGIEDISGPQCRGLEPSGDISS